MFVESINDGPVTMVYDEVLEEPLKNGKEGNKLE